MGVSEKARNSARGTGPSERFAQRGESCVGAKRRETATRLVLSDTGLDVCAFEDPEGLGVERRSGYSGPSQFSLVEGAIRSRAGSHLFANLCLHNGEIIGVRHTDTLGGGGDYRERGAPTLEFLPHDLG